MFKGLEKQDFFTHAGTHEAHTYKLTNLVCLVVGIVFLFYSGYGFYIGSGETTVFALAFMGLCLLSLLLNVKGIYGPAKSLILSAASLSICFTYHIYPIGEAVLTTFFPILLSFTFLFNLSKERGAFGIGLAFTVLMILLSLVLPRQLFYGIAITDSISTLSDRIHLIVTFLTTSILLYVAIRHKDRTNRDLRHALDDLDKAQGHLLSSEKMAAIGLLAAGINHEIRNPLNVLVAGIDQIQDLSKSGDKEEVEAYLDLMADSIERITRIVNSLSHFNHQAGDMEMKCDPHAILNNCLIILSSKPKHNIEIRKDFVSGLLVKGNSGLLHQVFFNLLVNAMDAIEDSGVIEIETKENEGHIEISIKDSGPGIPESIRHKIFEPFFTTKDPGRGTGLGLAISSKIVKDHGGKISVHSGPDGGTEFKVSLPAFASKE